MTETPTEPMSQALIRAIEPKDNAAVKTLVLDTLAEFGLFGDGFAGVDAELEDMHGAYDNALSAYYVVELNGQVAGVGGYAPLLGTEPGTVVELRKMYLTPALRGQGIGRQLIERCLQEAQALGYATMYLETVPGMQAAQALYQKYGFTHTEQRMGDTGHCNCSVTMARSLRD
ncbi:GNAT family N-acetyltransferase [Marinicella meishanensis]|uniref:GNAT family N-acetyltransferase n=1 Tax=Marinicella meishanensis TaxID=2873263 RepID=UPI001CC08C55|nr:GNAT family N-acetyltransferase [Marinicella sp. NBU2979]